jgi:hypothetical protein
MASSGMLLHVALVRTNISKELKASIIRVPRIGELGTTLVVTSNRRRSEEILSHPDYGSARFLLQQSHSITSQKMAFFMIHPVSQLRDPFLNWLRIPRPLPKYGKAHDQWLLTKFSWRCRINFFSWFKIIDCLHSSYYDIQRALSQLSTSTKHLI